MEHFVFFFLFTLYFSSVKPGISYMILLNVNFYNFTFKLFPVYDS